MSQKIRADQVKRALSKRHEKDFFMTEVKNGPTHISTGLLKLDAMAIKKSWVNPCVTGYEVKVDRSDFTRDNKWRGYMSYCHQFSFVCPTGLISLEELPNDVGLVYYKPETGNLVTKRKALYRNIEIPSEMLMYVIMCRLDNERHPFFSSAREHIESYMDDQDERKQLGRHFGIKITEEIRKLREEAKQHQREKERWVDDKRVLSEVIRLLREYGINVDYWNRQWPEQLKTMLSGQSVNPRAIQAAKNILSNAESLAKLLHLESVGM